MKCKFYFFIFRFNSFQEDIVKLKLDFPIYYLYIEKNLENNFNSYPFPGVIAFAQYSFYLNLEESIYISEENPIINQNIGFLYLKLENIMNLFKESTSFIERKLDHILSKYEFPEFIKNILYSTDLSDSNDDKRYPLIEELSELPDDTFTEKKFDNFKQGVILHRDYISKYQDENNFEDFFEEYSAMAISKKMKKKKDQNMIQTNHNNIQTISQSQKLESQEKIKEKSNEIEIIEIIDSDEETKPKKKSKENKINIEKEFIQNEKQIETKSNLIKMKNDDLIELFGLTYFQRGKDYYLDQRAFGIKTKKIDSLSFKFFSKCNGSREDPYQQVAIFQNGWFIKGKCSCPIGEDGKCKHMCAAILESINQEKPKENKNEPIPFNSIRPTEDWIIKCKVIEKYPVKSWTNERGNGEFGSILMNDDLNPEIKFNCTFFNENIEKYENLKVGKVYLLSRGHLIEKENGKFDIRIVQSTKIEESKRKSDETTEESPKKKKKVSTAVEYPGDLNISSMDHMDEYIKEIESSINKEEDESERLSQVSMFDRLSQNSQLKHSQDEIKEENNENQEIQEDIKENQEIEFENKEIEETHLEIGEEENNETQETKEIQETEFENKEIEEKETHFEIGENETQLEKEIEEIHFENKEKETKRNEIENPLEPGSPELFIEELDNPTSMNENQSPSFLIDSPTFEALEKIDPVDRNETINEDHKNDIINEDKKNEIQTPKETQNNSSETQQNGAWIDELLEHKETSIDDLFETIITGDKKSK